MVTIQTGGPLSRTPPERHGVPGVGGDAGGAGPRLRRPSRWPNSCLPPTGGKVVRVALEIPPVGSLEDTQELALPRRAGLPRGQVPPVPARPVEMITDPVLLQRVLDGLRQLDTDDPPGDGRTTHTDITNEDR